MPWVHSAGTTDGSSFAAACGNEMRSRETCHAHNVHQVKIHSGEPLVIGDRQHRPPRRVTAAVDDGIAAAETGDRQVNDGTQRVRIGIGTVDARAAQRLRQFTGTPGR